MKLFTKYLLLFNVICMSADANGFFKKIDLKSKITKGLHLIEDDETGRIDTLIKRIEFGKDRYRNKVIFSLKNVGDKRKKPRYDCKIYNNYGMKLGEVSLRWLLDMVDPGNSWSGEEYYKPPDFKEIFKHTDIVIPEDIDKPVWIEVTGNHLDEE